MLIDYATYDFCDACPMHQPVDSEESEARFRRLLHSLDLKKALNRFVFRGFDNYEDYFRYGEIFVPIKPRSEYTPEERKYLTPPPDPGK